MKARSAKGDLVDFHLLAIKAQLAQKPIPAEVQTRMNAIEEKDTGKPVPSVQENTQESLEQADVSAAKQPPKRK